MKRDAQFETDLDGILETVRQTQEIQIKQLKHTIQLLHILHKEELDINTIAQQIMDLPIEIKHTPTKSTLDCDKDLYHHCPQTKDNLVKLIPSIIKGIYVCPVCGLGFEQK